MTHDMDKQSVQPETAMKICVQCRKLKPLSEFSSRSGGRAGRRRRRGTCRACRQSTNKLESAEEVIEAVAAAAEEEATSKPKRRRRGRRRKAPKHEAVVETSEAVVVPAEEEPAAKPKRRRRRRRRKAAKPSAPQVSAAAALPAAAPAAEPAGGEKRAAPQAAPRKAARKSPVSKPEAPKIAVGAPKLDPHDADALRATRQGFVRMRGKTDSGRPYYQEIEPEFAKTLVREHAAYVVNRHTIRRIHSNREFRRLILTRDNYTCHFCGQYGDTIDHLLPRAKGGHTTPVNCVCACNECNQSKADRDLDEFTESMSGRRRLEPTV
ncbi:HNH endonuclease [Cohnella cellulosilytica]|uniref:HNH endonuclease n=2 Tax=Cohnella cellulosilytica TaxID=986710 RepID=A0ABW2FFH1_9BACL